MTWSQWLWWKVEVCWMSWTAWLVYWGDKRKRHESFAYWNSIKASDPDASHADVRLEYSAAGMSPEKNTGSLMFKKRQLLRKKRVTMINLCLSQGLFYAIIQNPIKTSHWLFIKGTRWCQHKYVFSAARYRWMFSCVFACSVFLELFYQIHQMWVKTILRGVAK